MLSPASDTAISTLQKKSIGDSPATRTDTLLEIGWFGCSFLHMGRFADLKDLNMPTSVFLTCLLRRSVDTLFNIPENPDIFFVPGMVDPIFDADKII